MAVLKCKMCGANLEIKEGASVVECEYCGSKNTLPKLNDEKRAAFFDRANFYRSKNEFDKASLIYENIVSEVDNEAEAYWGICLCRYGIEYVIDPKTEKRVPTCHRTQFKSILDDEDYKKAYENADIFAKAVYKEEAEYIDDIQKRILEISSKEEPFDIFICYKQTDDSTEERTLDSLIAEEIYNALVEEGYKVFFSMITLEDKLGMAYEPYIFAALHSAKVMLVVGTKADYFNAVWVKNEWSRYLMLIEQGEKKSIIPCYRDITPYELPEEFVALQGQNVSKVGWKQDLIRGINKIITPNNSVKTVKSNEVNKIKEIALSDGLYKGEVFANQPHGQGKCIYKNGNVYEGEWGFGVPNGKGKLTYSEGGSYEGDFVEGKFQGWGKRIYIDDCYYEGEWKNNERFEGTLYYDQGGEWTGRWGREDIGMKEENGQVNLDEMNLGQEKECGNMATVYIK